MTAESETNLVTHAAHHRGRGDVSRDEPCVGCLALTERVEQLESRLAALDPGIRPTPLGTMPCYWMSLSLHSLIAFSFFSSEMAMTIGYPFLIGAAGTMAVTHVLATRRIVDKMLRSSGAIVTVLSAVMLSLWLVNESRPQELLGAFALYVPLFLASGWLTAKGMVVAFGWRIVPPGGTREFFKVKIRDLMIITFAAAALFGLLRWTVAPHVDELFDDWLPMATFIVLPVMVATAVATLIARVVLTTQTSIGWLSLAGVLAAGFCVVLLCNFVVIYSIDEFDDWSSLFSYAVVLATIGVVSPMTTFALMRSAGYRFASPMPASDEVYQGPRT